MEPVCVWVCWILRRGLNAGLSNRGHHISQKWDETSSLLTLTKRTHAPTDSKSPAGELSSQHMDTGNESPGGREDRVSETHILQVDAPMSDSCQSERDLSHERQVTPSSSIERPHGDAGRGEFVLGGCRGGETLIFYRETRTICWSTCGNVFTLTNNHHIAITADSENGHEDAGRGELCVESRKREFTS
jgi:hypothetical protein